METTLWLGTAVALALLGTGMFFLAGVLKEHGERVKRLEAKQRSVYKLWLDYQRSERNK